MEEKTIDIVMRQKYLVKEINNELQLQSKFGITQSRMASDCSDVLISPYQQHMMLAFAFHPLAQNILHLGLGGGCMVRFIHNYWPLTTQTVIEKDPNIITIAHEKFFLPKSPRIQISLADAKILEQHKARPQYDLIFLDLYDEHGPVKYFFQKKFANVLKHFLREDGWIIGNVWGKEYKIWQKIFPQVWRAHGFGANEIVFGGFRCSVQPHKEAKILTHKKPLDFSLLSAHLECCS
jgi:hypothetical protein